jgi:hypothetical protein
MKKRVCVTLNENQVEFIENHRDDIQPVSKFIMESFMNNEVFKVSGKLRKRAKKRKINVSIPDDVYSKIEQLRGNMLIKDYIINKIFTTDDR